MLTNLLAAEFTGTVYPVNSEHRSVRGVRAYASVLDIPDPVDLAVVAIPAAGIDSVLDACLAKGVRTLVVLSSGFADVGPEGTGAERRLVAEARAHGMRVVGPNALGVANTDPAVRLNATLAPRLPGPGHTGFFCQSGALGIAILADAATRGLGLSTFVSAGNRADVSGNDLLQYWETDAATEVVLLYLESFGNPRKFARLARRLARHKPIVVVKSGAHAVRPGLAATSVPVDDASVRALFEQSGVIRVESLADLFDTALLLANQPLPAGERVAVVGNSTAIGLLAADTRRSRRACRLAGEPVDTGTEASPEAFAAAVRDVLHRDDVDALVIVFVPPLVVPGAAYARALRAVVDEEAAPRKPVVSTFLAVEGVPAELAVPGPDGTPGYGSVPSYPSPERAVMALARAVRYARVALAAAGQLCPARTASTPTARRAVAAAAPTTDDGPAGARPTRSRCGCWVATASRSCRSAGGRRGRARPLPPPALGYPVAVKSTERETAAPHRSGRRAAGPGHRGRRCGPRTGTLRAVSGVDDVIVQRMVRPRACRASSGCRTTRRSVRWCTSGCPASSATCSATARTPRSRSPTPMPPAWSARRGRPRCWPATGAPNRSTWPRWPIWCCGWPRCPRTCRRSGRWCWTRSSRWQRRGRGDQRPDHGRPAAAAAGLRAPATALGQVDGGATRVSTVTERKISRTAVVHAPADRIFDLLTDPTKHPLIDGSGTVLADPGPAAEAPGAGLARSA